jgi:hypothetical protein
MTTEAEYTETFKNLVPQSGEPLTREKMTEILMRHELFEFDEDLDGVMTTLIDVPVYELHPQGYRITGREAVRVLYERTLPIFLQFDYRRKEVDTRDIKCVAFSDNQIAAELNDEFEFPDGSRKRVYLTVIAEFSGDLVVGERLYLDNKLAGLYEDALGEDFFALPGVAKL